MSILNNGSAILPAKQIVNRKERRLFTKEALSIVEDLEEVNASFLYYLFSEDEKSTYDELYREFSELWIKKIEHIVETRKLKFTLLDKSWFYNNYAPEKNYKY